MKKTIQLLIATFVLSIFITGCSHDHDHETAHAHDDHAHESDTHPEEPHQHSGEEEHMQEESPETEGAFVEEVEMTATQIEKIDLQLGSFVERPLKSVIQVNGYLELPPQNRADVSTMIGGNVKDIKVVQGDYVKKGQLLAVLEHPDFIEWQQEYLNQVNRLNYLEKEYERQKALAQENIAAQKDFQQTESAYFSTKAATSGLRSKLQLIGLNINTLEKGKVISQIPIRAPINGYVRTVNVSLGTYVSPQMKLMAIVDNHHIHIDLLVYEKDINQVHVGQKVLFRLPSQPGNEYEAEIYAIGKALEEEEKAVRVHADIDNESEELLPGMYVDGRIIVGKQMISSLPEQALVTDKGLDYIFIKNEKESDEQQSHFHKVQVIRGVSDAGYVEVTPLEPIAEGTPIVTEGAFFLMAETKKGEGGGHGHHH